MSSLVIWIDQEKAHLFHFSPAGFRREVHRMHGKQHPKEVHGKNHPLWQSDTFRFYNELANRLANYGETEWLVFGPGLARIHFQRFLEERRPELMKRIVGSETMPPELESGILKRARSFFRRLRIFQGLLPGR